jgi:outer membrane protein W
MEEVQMYKTVTLTLLAAIALTLPCAAIAGDFDDNRSQIERVRSQVLGGMRESYPAPEQSVQFKARVSHIGFASHDFVTSSGYGVRTDFDATWMIGPELIIMVSPEFAIEAAASYGTAEAQMTRPEYVGYFGELELIPITLNGRWYAHPYPKTSVFLMGGGGYFVNNFEQYDNRSLELLYDDEVQVDIDHAWSVQVGTGFNYRLGNDGFFEVSVAHFWTSPTGSISTPDSEDVELEISPWVVNVSLGIGL